MPSRNAIYLDSNASAPLQPQAVEAILELLKPGAGEGSLLSLLANPSSIHSHGRISKRRLSEARESVARSLGPQTDPEQLIFTSSGTEANQMAIRSYLEPWFAMGKYPHWITTPVEHDSIRQLVRWTQEHGGQVSLLPVDSMGRPDFKFLKNLLTPQTACVALIHVNNETGVITDLFEASAVCKDASVPLHLDSAQAWGKIPIDVHATGAQSVALSGHKIGSPAGTGVLWVRDGSAAQPLTLGKQEKGRRGGTENLLGLVALGAAAAQIPDFDRLKRAGEFRDFLEAMLKARVPETRVHGEGASRVPNTTNVSFDGVEGDGLVMAMDLAGFSVSAGSACASGVIEPSHVLTAMGLSPREAMAALRISVWDSPETGGGHAVAERFVSAIERIIARYRASAVKGLERQNGMVTDERIGGA